MSVFRVEKNKGYAVMSNHDLRNHALSLKAKGLLSQKLSLPEDWDYTLQNRFRSSQASYRLPQVFLFHSKTNRVLILLLLASKANPLRWASVWLFMPHP